MIAAPSPRYRQGPRAPTPGGAGKSRVVGWGPHHPGPLLPASLPSAGRRGRRSRVSFLDPLSPGRVGVRRERGGRGSEGLGGGVHSAPADLRREPLVALEDPEALEPLSAVDHAWLRMDDPTNLMIINGCLVLERNLDRERIKALLERRLLPIRRFRQRVVRKDGTPYWIEDPDFDLD